MSHTTLGSDSNKWNYKINMVQTGLPQGSSTENTGELYNGYKKILNGVIQHPGRIKKESRELTS